jgi:hypothetical protein
MPTRERFPLRRAYGGTSRPDKCLVVSRWIPACALWPCANTPSQHGIHRRHHQGVKGSEGRPLLGRQCCFPLSRRGKIRLCHHSLSAAARGGNLFSADGRRPQTLGQCRHHHETLAPFCPLPYHGNERRRLTERRTMASLLQWFYCVTISTTFLGTDHEHQSQTEWTV